jgi:hypothetical protein
MSLLQEGEWGEGKSVGSVLIHNLNVPGADLSAVSPGDLIKYWFLAKIGFTGTRNDVAGKVKEEIINQFKADDLL